MLFRVRPRLLKTCYQPYVTYIKWNFEFSRIPISWNFQEKNFFVTQCAGKKLIFLGNEKYSPPRWSCRGKILGPLFPRGKNTREKRSNYYIFYLPLSLSLSLKKNFEFVSISVTYWIAVSLWLGLQALGRLKLITK